jgi:hypothetical protein
MPGFSKKEKQDFYDNRYANFDLLTVRGNIYMVQQLSISHEEEGTG